MFKQLFTDCNLCVSEESPRPLVSRRRMNLILEDGLCQGVCRLVQSTSRFVN